MSFGKPIRLLKAEAIITVIILAAAMMFALEPTREFLIGGMIERQYDDLKKFERAADSLNMKKVREKELRYIITSLDTLDNPDKNFILKDDAQILKARAYLKLGAKSRAKEILNFIIKDSGDPLARIDAMLILANLYDEENAPRHAIQLIEQYKELSPYYKKSEISFLLARLYYQTGNYKSSGKAAITSGKLDPDERPFYEKIVLMNWKYYERDEKKEVLKSLSRMGLHESFANCASKYIEEFKPSYDEAETITLDIVYNSRGGFVTGFLNRLKNNPDYLPIYEEMTDLYHLSTRNIRSQSGTVRGYYYYRKLRPLAKRARYNDKKALEFYANYLKGNVDSTYVIKNLRLTIRNLLAFKNYAEITNTIEKSCAVLNMDTNTAVLSDDIAFWNAYAAYKLGDSDKAQHYFEGAISKVPDGYFAINARTYLETIVEQKGGSWESYMDKTQARFYSAKDLPEKLFYGRLLFSFKRGAEKESLRQKIVTLTGKFNHNVYFDFDPKVLDQIKNNESYVRFIVHTRFGILDKAKAILSSADISDPNIQDLLILRELVRNKDFKVAGKLFNEFSGTEFLNENFAFLPKELQMTLYPTPYDSEISLALNQLRNNQLDSYLVYAIIRGESMYIPDARSWVGARGLMQLMPATARLISGKVLGKREVNLYNPVNNIMLGTSYLNDGILSYGFVPAIASYNGGIRVINFTRQKFYPENELELMELVPYNETREYIKKILSYYFRYKNIYESGEWKISLVPSTRKRV